MIREDWAQHLDSIQITDDEVGKIIDRIRTARTKQFRYIRNYFTDRPYMQLNYRDEWEITKMIRKLHVSSYSEELQGHRNILENWVKETDDKGQYPEDKPNLKYMFDWWGEKCVNPEYDIFR